MTQPVPPSPGSQVPDQSSKIGAHPTQPLPAQPPSGQNPAPGRARFLLCLLRTTVFVVFIRNSDALQILGLIATLLSINMFEAIIKPLDRFDKHISYLEKRLKVFLRH